MFRPRTAMGATYKASVLRSSFLPTKLQLTQSSKQETRFYMSATLFPLDRFQPGIRLVHVGFRLCVGVPQIPSRSIIIHMMSYQLRNIIQI